MPGLLSGGGPVSLPAAPKPKTLPGNLIPGPDVLDVHEGGLADALIRRLNAGEPYSFATQTLLVGWNAGERSQQHDRSWLP